MALGMIDVDYFKKYNDQYGHQAGDACLARVAQELSNSLARTGDVVARYGGEEFVFIALNCNGSDALAIAQNICKVVEALALPHTLSNFGVVTVSVGVAAVNPKVGVAPAILIKAADDALYQVKHKGRNHAVLDTADGTELTTKVVTDSSL